MRLVEKGKGKEVDAGGQSGLKRKRTWCGSIEPSSILL
jgi:hypothetical protein